LARIGVGRSLPVNADWQEAVPMGELVSHPGGGATLEGYVAKPASGNGAGLLVLHEWWGLVPHIRELCDRFAEAGFVAFAPDLYRGTQPVGPVEAAELLAELDLERVGGDIGDGAAYLAGRPDVTGGVGAVGFGLGGSLALWAATRCAAIKVAVGFYPVLAWNRLGPRWSDFAGKAAMIHRADRAAAVDRAGRGETPEPAALAREAVLAIKDAGGTAVAHHYAGTRPAFVNDDRPECYDRDAARVAWARTLAFLRGHLG
jgi:carboxymethylenebutenolidase